MDKLDERNSEAFGDATRKIVNSMTMQSGAEIGKLVENIYLRFQREAERDARDRVNGKGD